MQVQKKSEQGLVAEFKVIIPKEEVQKRIDDWIQSQSKTFKMDGFRPGKVPAAVIQKQLGGRARVNVVDDFIKESMRKIIDEHQLRPAVDPRFSIEKDIDSMDLEFDLTVENFPIIDLKDFKDIKVNRLIHSVAPQEVNEDIQRLYRLIPDYEDASASHSSQDQDQVVYDIECYINGKLIADYSGSQNYCILGKTDFGFPEINNALYNKKTGDHVEVKTRFPEQFKDFKVAGRDVVFKIDIKEVKTPKESEFNEAFAKKIGFKDLAALKDERNTLLQKERDRLIKFYHKRKVLDALDEQYNFELPPQMLQQEFNAIWTQLQEELKQGKESKTLSQEELDKPEEEYKKEYTKIAERRVRLGILIADIAFKNNIQVTDQKMAQIIWDEASRFPGQEKEVVEYYRNHHKAREQLRSPALEELVIEFILERATINTTEVDYPQLKKLIQEVLPGFEDDSEESSPAPSKKVKSSSAKKK